MARPLPKKGFYTFNSAKYAQSQGWSKEPPGDECLRVYYSTGTTKGNYWIDFWDGKHPRGSQDEWWKLNWVALPSVKDAAEHHDYSEENPLSLPLPQD